MNPPQRPSMYPFPTELRTHTEPQGKAAVGGYSIFLTAVKHRVQLQAFTDWWQVVGHRGWRLHEYLTYPKHAGGSEWRRRFQAEMALSPGAADTLFGETFPSRVIETDAVAQQALAKRRLDPHDAECRRCETLLLTLVPGRAEQWLGVPLQVRDPWAPISFRFRIEWVDVWLMPGERGLLAFKVALEEVGIKDQGYPPRVGDLGHLNRLLRYIPRAPDAGLKVCRADASQEGASLLWQDIIAQRWFGLGGQGDLLWLAPGADPWADRYTDYAKVLTVAHIAPIESGIAEWLWNCPQTEPPLAPPEAWETFARAGWSPVHSAYQRGAIAGYPSLGDVLLYELASGSSEGAALGRNGQRGWQVSMDYLRALFKTSGISIWEYWQGLCLRDTCAFLAYDDSMPIREQAESRYYPLYAHTYFSQCRLHELSEDIIDHDLRDVPNARRIRDTFTAFRNQYWFREVAMGFQGIEVARRIRLGMDLDALYESVASEVAEVGEFVDNKISAGRQALLGLLVVLFYPLTLLWGIFKDDVVKWVSGLSPGWTALAVLCLLLLVAVALGFAAKLGVLAQRLSDWMWRRNF